MRFVQTLFIDDSKDPFQDGFGWIKPEYHLMGWALSCLQLKKFYGSVDLYANTKASNVLIDKIKLPYSEVYLEHDNFSLTNTSLWALPKVFTYSLQDKPFLHIDGDVFLFDRFPELLLSSELIVQNIEQATDYYTSTQKELIEHFSYFPECVRNDFFSSNPIKAVNAGILGGRNIQFIKEYTKEAFDYVMRNVNHLSSINVNRFNVFFEQHLFYSLAKEQQIPIGLYFGESMNDNEYINLGNFHEVPLHRSYLHLLGDYKRDEYTCLKMAAKLRELYPEYYYSILSLCKVKDVSLSDSFCYYINLNDSNSVNEYHETTKKIYLKGDSDFDHVSLGLGNNFYSCESSNYSLLKEIFNYYYGTVVDTSEMIEFRNDFMSFSRDLLDVIQMYNKVSCYYLYGRDLESTDWYHKIFENNEDVLNSIISKDREISIIESGYDWAGLINKFKRAGVKYYMDVKVTQGRYFNLIVPEVSNERFSMYDITEFEKVIIDILITPMSLNNLLQEMKCYFEDDVVHNNSDIYKKFILEIVKDLVLKKVIKPNCVRVV